MLVENFSQARAYTNVIMVAGYAGMFALWNMQADRLTPVTSLSVGLLLAISLAAFVGWEIYGMVERFSAMSAMRKSLDNPVRFAGEVKRYSQRTTTLMRVFERYWHPVIWIAAGSAVLAMAILLSAFAHGIVLTTWPQLIRRGASMEFGFLSIVAGGFIAGLAGILSFRWEAGRTRKHGKKALASALEADLRTSAELFSEIAKVWKNNQAILFDTLDQLEFVRSNFAVDRPNFGLLHDEDMRLRLNEYFRKSYVILRRLRQHQENIYSTDDLEEKGSSLS